MMIVAKQDLMSFHTFTPLQPEGISNPTPTERDCNACQLMFAQFAIKISCNDVLFTIT